MACIVDQVTDTKSRTQSNLFTDSISMISLKFDNKTDSLVCGTLVWPGQPQRVCPIVKF